MTQKTNTFRSVKAFCRLNPGELFNFWLGQQKQLFCVLSIQEDIVFINVKTLQYYKEAVHGQLSGLLAGSFKNLM